MTRFFLAFAITVALVVSLPAISKADKILLKTISSGTYGPADVPVTLGGNCDDGGCVGLLTGLTCAGLGPNVEAISPVEQTFYFIDQVCEDRPSSSLPACAGRYTSVVEECSRLAAPTAPPGSDEHLDDTVKSRESSGLYIVCFDDSATDTCPPVSASSGGVIIASGTTRSHTSHVSGTEILTGVAQLTDTGGVVQYDDPDTGRKNDSWQRSVGTSVVVHSNAQINGGAACPADLVEKCGVASTGFANQ